MESHQEKSGEGGSEGAPGGAAQAGGDCGEPEEPSGSRAAGASMWVEGSKRSTTLHPKSGTSCFHANNKVTLKFRFIFLSFLYLMLTDCH